MPANDANVPPKWIGVMGEWEPEDQGIRFLGKGTSMVAGAEPFPVGIAAGDVERFTEGEIVGTVRFLDVKGLQHTAGIILGFRSPRDPFYYAEFGDTCGFSISAYLPAGLYYPLARNQSSQLLADSPYNFKVILRGRFAELRVNGVKVVEAVLPDEPAGHQLALLASGHTPVIFEHLLVNRALPRAFVATEFTTPFNRIWNTVIRKAAAEEGFNPIRIDEVAGPNPILAEIKRHITEAAVVIAEITPLNANVFYELGFADARNKRLVILAQKGVTLPFDIRGYRVVFYDDVIGGEIELTKNLRNQLRAALP